ncbi:sensor histidine kinase [Lachnospiraceae bacterium LCP25S3_G4]
MYNNIFEICSTIIQSIITFEFLTKFFESKYQGKLRWIRFIGGVLLFFSFLMISNNYQTFGILNVLGGTFILLVYVFTSLKGTNGLKTFIVVMVEIGVAITAWVSTFTVAYLSKTPVDYFIASFCWERILQVTMANLMYFYVTRWMLQFRKSNKVKWSEIIFLLISPLTTGIILFALMDNLILSATNMIQKRDMLLILGCLVGSSIATYCLFVRISKDNEIGLKYNLLQQQYKLEKENVKDIVRLHKEGNRMQHDMKNILSVAIGYLEDKKYEKAYQYLNEIRNEKVAHDKAMIYCDNDAINYILSEKSACCKQQGILCYYTILGKMEELPYLDISIVLGNLLDNAIEASKKIHGAKIELLMKYTQGYLELTVKNMVVDEILKSNPDLLTNKKDTCKHGWGIDSVKEIVKKYQGTIEFTQLKNIFICRVELLI